MHKINIPAYVDERALQRRGRVKIYDQIDPARTAHIVVDLQNGFMAPGEVCEIGTARESVSRAFKQLRSQGLIEQGGGNRLLIPNVARLRTYARGG